jgi:hypothetical protein
MKNGFRRALPNTNPYIPPFRSQPNHSQVCIFNKSWLTGICLCHKVGTIAPVFVRDNQASGGPPHRTLEPANKKPRNVWYICQPVSPLLWFVWHFTTRQPWVVCLNLSLVNGRFLTTLESLARLDSRSEAASFGFGCSTTLCPSRPGLR